MVAPVKSITIWGAEDYKFRTNAFDVADQTVRIEDVLDNICTDNEIASKTFSFSCKRLYPQAVRIALLQPLVRWRDIDANCMELAELPDQFEGRAAPNVDHYLQAFSEHESFRMLIHLALPFISINSIIEVSVLLPVIIASSNAIPGRLESSNAISEHSVSLQKQAREYQAGDPSRL